MIEKILCKKTFVFKGGEFVKDGVYDYWTNFGGANHIVSDGTETIPFKGELESNDNRPYIFDYFYEKNEMREVIIDRIS